MAEKLKRVLQRLAIVMDFDQAAIRGKRGTSKRK
jgi:hypothetical protein